jgi:hypothetical protein
LGFAKPFRHFCERRPTAAAEGEAGAEGYAEAAGSEAGDNDRSVTLMSDPDHSRNARLLSLVGIAAIAAIGVFAFFARRSVTVEQVQPDAALQRFAEIRNRLPWTEPILHIDAAGVVTRREAPPDGETPHATRLHVVAYRAPQGRLVRAVAPFWFLKVKGVAVQYALRDTGLDLERLGVTPTDLERYGACLVLDETRRNGDRLLVWTE